MVQASSSELASWNWKGPAGGEIPISQRHVLSGRAVNDAVALRNETSTRPIVRREDRNKTTGNGLNGEATRTKQDFEASPLRVLSTAIPQPHLPILWRKNIVHYDVPRLLEDGWLSPAGWGVGSDTVNYLTPKEIVE